MFGKRSTPANGVASPPGTPVHRVRPVRIGPSPRSTAASGGSDDRVEPSQPAIPSAPASARPSPMVAAPGPPAGPSPDEGYYQTKQNVFDSLLETVDLTQLGQLDDEAKRAEISEICRDIIGVKGHTLNAAKESLLISDICDDMLGLGPLEPLLARDDIADIMVNGYDRVFIETGGRIELTPVRFRDNAQLMNICQRIVGAVGRRVDESNPICDARLADGSRVNVIAPPLALDGPTLTIRKFKRDKLTLEKLIQFGTASPACATVLRIAAASRCNILISGGTGSGKTTLLNCLTRFIDPGERIVTCEDAAELQLQQSHVVRLETRPANLEGKGLVTMRDLVRNCLRMRPERIIVGEVRGPEAFDLLQAMNTGHDGSMGTLHANSPREATNRLENMIAMGGFNLPTRALREQITAAIDLVVQAQRLRDGSRKITQITELVGMEGDVITMQDLFKYEIDGEDERSRIAGRHVSTGLRPRFMDKASYFGLSRDLMTAMDDAA